MHYFEHNLRQWHEKEIVCEPYQFIPYFNQSVTCRQNTLKLLSSMIATMETYTLKIIDVFTEKPFQGNPAGVILSGKALSKRTCQKIAREVNLPATCFVCKVNEDFKVRFFTPLNEIKMCGHGAIAVIHNLIEDRLISVKKPKTFFKLKTFTKTFEAETFFEKNAVKVVWVNFGKPTFF